MKSDKIQAIDSKDVPDFCMNCNSKLIGDYCHNCGQDADTERFQLRKIPIIFFNGFVDLDSKTLNTAFGLFIRPGKLILDYIKGNRVTYLGALRYYVLVVAINIGISAVFETTATPNEGMAEGFWDRNFVALQISLVYAIILFPLALFQRLFHWEGFQNYIEHYIFLLFLLAQSILVVAVIRIFTLPFGIELDGDLDGIIWLTVFTVFTIWAGHKFYKESIWHVIWKTLASYSLVVVLSVFIAMIVLGLYNLFV